MLIAPLDAQSIALWRCLERAAAACARGKLARPDVARFRAHKLAWLDELTRQLRDGVWRPAPGLVFVTTRPKCREVHAARFSDRVVHHLLAEFLVPEIERRLSNACYACRPGKGTHRAVQAVQDWMRRLGRQGGRRVWALHLDVVNCFHSVDRERLWQYLQPVLRRVAAGWAPFDVAAAVRAVLRDDPGRTAQRVGSAGRFAQVPPHKRLGMAGPGVGLPVGNLLSQWFVNAYLGAMDGFVQRTLGVAGYVRYMDDMVLLHTDRAVLEHAAAQLHLFAAARLGLQLQQRKVIAPVSHGVDFCGAIIRPDYALPRRRVVLAWRQRCMAAQQHAAPIVVPAGRSVQLQGVGRIKGPCAVWNTSVPVVDGLRQAFASGLGATKRYASHQLQRRAMRTLHALGRWTLRVRNQGRVRMRLRVGDVAAATGKRVWRSLQVQTASLDRQTRGAVLLCQWGGRMLVRRRRDAQHLGWAWPCLPPHGGCRMAEVDEAVQHVLGRDRAVAIVVEGQAVAGMIRPRQVCWWIEPLSRCAAWWEQQTGTQLDTTSAGRPSWPEPAGWLRRHRRTARLTKETP